MIINAHQITADQVRALADGTGTSAELEILAHSQRSKTVAMLELVTRQAARSRHPEGAAAASGSDLLARVQHEAPAAAEELLRYPAVGAWAGETLIAIDSPLRYAGHPGHLALIAAAAAIRGGVRAVVELPAPLCDGLALHLPSLGSVVLSAQLRGRGAVLRHGGGMTEISWGREKVVLPPHLTADADPWRALATVSAGPAPGELRLVIDDADPYRLPGYDGSLDLLTGHERAQWRRRLEGGWRLLALEHDRIAADVLALVSAITPLGAADGGRRSSTSRYAFGTVGLSLPEDDMAMALTLAHEVQHVKLCALTDLLPLVTDQDHRLYYAPWRPDPRPLASLLQGMYAHLGVARFWWRQREVTREPAEVHRAYVEFDRWRNACAQVAVVVRNRPELTRCGAIFVDGMIRMLHRWQAEQVPPTAQAEARRAAEEHRRRWGKRGTTADYARGMTGNELRK